MTGAGSTKRASELAVAAVLGSVLLAACGGSSSTTSTKRATTTSATPSAQTTQPAPSATGAAISGTWRGTATSQAHPGRTSSFTVVFSQRGSTVSGPVTLTGGCISQGSVTGTLVGQTIQFGVVERAGIEFTGTFSGSSMSGSYKSEPPCGIDTDTGTWEATRAG